LKRQFEKILNDFQPGLMAEIEASRLSHQVGWLISVNMVLVTLPNERVDARDRPRAEEAALKKGENVSATTKKTETLRNDQYRRG
jgi:hypothetical protein